MFEAMRGNARKVIDYPENCVVLDNSMMLLFHFTNPVDLEALQYAIEIIQS